MRASLTLLAVTALAPLIAAQTASVADHGITTMQSKLQHIRTNSALPQPDQTPTEFSEAEINAYCASWQVKLPAGVQSVRFEGQPGTVTGTARVDFDTLKAGRSSYNPLLSVFSGVHDVVVMTHAHAAAGHGMVHVDSVSLDGVEIPRFVLQLFVDKYLHPKYPNVGLDSRFALPNRIDTATVGLHVLTVTQK